MLRPYDNALFAQGDGDVSVLDKYAGAVPVGGEVGASVEGDTATLTFTWRTWDQVISSSTCTW